MNVPPDHTPEGERHDDLPEIAPSALFAELVRHVANRHAETQPLPQSEQPQSPDGAPLWAENQPMPSAVRLPEVPIDSPKPAPPPIPEVPPRPAEEHQERIQAQRVQRLQKSKERRFRRRVGILGGFIRTLLIIFLAGGLASTIFTWFTAPDFLDKRVISGLAVANATSVLTVQPTLMPTPNYLRKIGIVSGHRGPENDPGAVCPDGLTEASINFDVATRVVRNLRALGYSVDLLDEFDARLNNYQASALVSIHANTCQDFGEFVSGYLVANAAVRPQGGPDGILTECVAKSYGEIINIERRFSLTVDMTDYHTFREIHPLTPATIIELGFMKDDREILTTRQDDMAKAITEGVLCFLNPPPPNPNAVFATPELLTTPNN